MQGRKSMGKNFIMSALLAVSSVIFPLITYPYASRVLGPEGIGRVSLAYSVITYFMMFARLGIPTYGVHICAKVRDDKEALSRTVQELLLINLMITVVSYVLLFLTVNLVPRFQAHKELYYLMSIMIILDIIGVEWLFKALEEYSYITIRSVFFKIIAVIAMFALVRGTEDYVLYGFISIFAVSASNVMNFFRAGRYVTGKKIQKYNFKRHFKAVSVFFAMACATTISTHLDTVMLGFLSTDAAVGYYSTAIKVKIILVNLVTSVGAVLLPRASYLVEHGLMEEFRVNCKKAINFVLLVAPAMAVYFILYAEQTILLMSGKAYMSAVLPMQIIMPTLIFIGITNIFGVQMLIPFGKETVVLRSVVAGSVVNIICNALLIPQWGANGAAVGTLVAELVVFVVQYRVLRKQMEGVFRSVQYTKILLALIGAVAASLWVAHLPLYHWVALVLSACLFFGVYCLVLVVLKETLMGEVLAQIGRVLSLQYTHKGCILKSGMKCVERESEVRVRDMSIYEEIYDVVTENLHTAGRTFEYGRDTFLCDVGTHPRDVIVSRYVHLPNESFVEAIHVAALKRLPDERTAAFWAERYDMPREAFQQEVLRSIDRSTVVALNQIRLLDNPYFQQNRGIRYKLLGTLYGLTDKSNLRVLGKKMPAPIQRIIRKVFL
ncbi:MAG: flippase [Lachnospiraceae bacterium]|nr:flippase [Lachnospiraceae bacterium]